MGIKAELNRRNFLNIASAGALAGAPSAGRAAQPLQAPYLTENRRERPNVLVLMTDQQRTDSLSCYGGRALRTPNLDRLAESGALFENCYVNNPICTPSRASMWTGKIVPGHGVYRLYDTLPEDEVLVPYRLRQAGYHTALFGKLHVSGRIYEATRRHPHDGFDVYEWCLEPSLSMDSPFNGYSQWLREKDPEFYRRMKTLRRKLLHHPRELHMTHWAAERTINFIQNSRPDQPFFCLMSVFDPHDPYEGYPLAMERFVDRRQIPDPVMTPVADKPYGIRYEHEHSYLGAFKNFTLEQIRQIRFGYLAAVALIDLEIGRVLKALEEKGIAGETLVIFTSDHGDMLGDHELMVKGAFFYDPAGKVPLIIRWPGHFRGGQRLTQLVQLNDLAGTMLSAAGCFSEDVRARMPGSRDLLPLATREKCTVHDHAVCCYRNTGIFDTKKYADPEIHCTMLREDRFKLNAYHSPVFQHGLEGELYDMTDDPLEKHNLWREPEFLEVRRRLTEELMIWFAAQERHLGSRGGEMFPKPSQRLNNKL